MRRTIGRIVGLAVLASAGWVATAAAANKFYVGPAGFSTWSIGTNWSPAGAPAQGDNVFFTPSDAITRSINYTGSSGTLLTTFGAVTLAPTGTAVIQLFNNADLEAASLNVGLRSSYFTNSSQNAFFGSIAINGGTVRRLGGSGAINAATVNHNSGNLLEGNYNVSQQYTFAGGAIEGGAVINNNGHFNASGGSFVQSSVNNNGTFTATAGGTSSSSLIENNGTIIFAGGGVGVVNNRGSILFNADPTFAFLRNFSLPMTVAAGRTFTFTAGLQQDGSTFTQIGNVVCGFSSIITLNSSTYHHQSGTLSSVGSYNINAGTFIAAGGNRSGRFINLTNGTFLHSAGAVNLSDIANLNANSTGANSLYSISAGTFSAGALVLNSSNAATTSFVQSGGDVLVGTLAINRGTTGFSGLNQSGGRFQVSSPGVPAVNNASIVQTGGLSRYHRIDGTGSISVGGDGSMTVTGIRQASVNLSGNGRILVSTTPGPIPILVNSLNFVESGGTVQGALDLGETPLIIDYSGASPIAAIARALKSGHASGNWTGTGLRSATAALDASKRTAIGMAQATNVGSPSMFFGQPIDATTVLLRYTIYGDADLSGSVNLDDFTRLAAGFGSGTVWSQGDFNYDGAVNLDDFTALAANFGQSLPAESARTSVPEPAFGLALVLAGAGSMNRPRRRRA